MTGTVLTEDVVGGVRVVTLNRPHRLNAIVPELLEESDRGAAARPTPTPRCAAIVLTGAGRAFCSGDDLKEFGSQAADAAATRAYIERIQDVTRAMVLGDTPVVGAIRGWAVGGGLEWLINCDFAIAAEGTRCFFPEVSWGVFVTGGVTELLPRLVGLQRARELIMLGERFDAAQAQAWGLVYKRGPRRGADAGGARAGAADRRAAGRPGARPAAHPGAPHRRRARRRDGGRNRRHRARLPRPGNREAHQRVRVSRRYTSTSATVRACSWMNWKRSSGRRPIRLSTRSAVRARSSGGATHLQQRALRRVHRGFLQLRRRHLAEALEAADLDLRAGFELGFACARGRRRPSRRPILAPWVSRYSGGCAR